MKKHRSEIGVGEARDFTEFCRVLRLSGAASENPLAESAESVYEVTA
ncbi:MAG: hypothetical protein HZA88_25040 [Verrucomicrobia bacterium]|nr:hypothetical protein [Verrucomicrobiota bacterium]